MIELYWWLVLFGIINTSFVEVLEFYRHVVFNWTEHNWKAVNELISYWVSANCFKSLTFFLSTYKHVYIEYTCAYMYIQYTTKACLNVLHYLQFIQLFVPCRFHISHFTWRFYVHKSLSKLSLCELFHEKPLFYDEPIARGVVVNI